MAFLDTFGGLENQKSFFESIKQEENFVGSLYDLDYDSAKVLVNDYDKNNVKGLPHGCLLIAIYHNELRANEIEGILLRVIGTAEIPQKKEIIQSFTDMYISKKDGRDETKIDIYTRHFYQFSGLMCRALGTFYEDENKKLVFGTDIENFLGAHNYKVYKPKKEQLQIIINQNIRTDEPKEKIGELRYSSSQSYDKAQDYAAEVYLKTDDIIARRSAFFGMTRTGKSNTIKIIISAIEKLNLNRDTCGQIGQIIFDINGEYTFANRQDENSIYDTFKQKAIRFSSSTKKAQEHQDVKVIQYDFYNDETLEESFSLLCDEISISGKKADYITHFMNVNLFDVNDETDLTEIRGLERKRALYKCILYKAKFEYDTNTLLNFTAFSGSGRSIPKGGVSIEEACKYFDAIDQRLSNVESKYKQDKDYESLLKVFHGKVSGYKFLMNFNYLHSLKGGKDYRKDIDSALRQGKIVLIDLSTVSTQTQQKYIDRLCSHIFGVSMDKFTRDEKPEYIQMYFEEAHNIFPKDDKDLKNIYNRLAKEGAKLNIGISYSTQEVSSISPSILKNTQNWFISHLNSQDEIKFLEKYYDFGDFSHNIMKNSDVGFGRIKTHSNNFIIPVQIKKF
ncbi:ATP-binding protein [Helicobacter cinaedi]|uniref:ATP-binding protein n=1 Tax=Helicobacter cinaedi TaxID=213 RepID=UPI001F26FF89|nr:DUF87 domain-containing protein [Helicobacter cinaedi]